MLELILGFAVNSSQDDKYMNLLPPIPPFIHSFGKPAETWEYVRTKKLGAMF